MSDTWQWQWQCSSCPPVNQAASQPACQPLLSKLSCQDNLSLVLAAKADNQPVLLLLPLPACCLPILCLPRCSWSHSLWVPTLRHGTVAQRRTFRVSADTPGFLFMPAAAANMSVCECVCVAYFRLRCGLNFAKRSKYPAPLRCGLTPVYLLKVDKNQPANYRNDGQVKRGCHFGRAGPVGLGEKLVAYSY